MRRGDLYRVYRGSANDPKDHRVFVVMSRNVLIHSRHSTVICAPVFSSFDGLSTQVAVGADEGLKHESAIHCDELVSILKAKLSDFVGQLPPRKLQQLDRALAEAVGLQDA